MLYKDLLIYNVKNIHDIHMYFIVPNEFLHFMEEYKRVVIINLQ